MISNQLSNIAVQYRKFSKGQYIEHTQFNEFLDLFEDQDRLSRVMLQGVGIVCGFKPDLIYTNRILTSIQLSQGVAVTTDGDLLTLNNTNKVSEDLYVGDLKTVDIKNENFTHFKAYDNFKVNYPAFHEDNSKGDQIELWELGTAQEINLDFQPISNLTNLEDKYLLLYLESYEKDVKPCRGVDCDNHGVQQIRNLKVLVTTLAGITTILGKERLIINPITGEVIKSRKDRVQPHPLFIDGIMGGMKQERVIVERLILNNDPETSFSSFNFKKMYSDVLEKNKYGEAIFEKINAISQVFGTQTVDYPNFKAALDNLLSQDIGFQYAYDAVQDLTDTYSEIIKLLPEAFVKSLPDLDSFPKHIMLGKLISNENLDFSRHQFYNSPVLDDKKMTEKVKVLISRFSQQVRNFKYPIAFGDLAPIKITPSQKLNPLSKKAIPFYYNVTDQLLKTWNFDKTSHRSSRYNLGYDGSLLSLEDHVQNPASYNIDKSSFYNIEGHQGMNYREVFSKLKQLKDKFQLGFDIMVLSLEKLVDNKDLFKGYFNEYVDKNPGLEHKRGVERGGTFVIVYESVENPVVFADFSLPYICCTPKTEVKLSLPDTVICSASKHIPFTVSPLNGDVEAMVGAGLKGGVEFSNGQYFFNPELVSPELYGQSITFTVNGKATNCSIKVVPQPKVEIVAHSVDYPTGNSMPTILHFTIAELNGYNLMDYDYQWDFWDDGGLITLIPDADGNFVYKLYNLDPKQIPTIRLYVSNADCTQAIIIRDWYVAPKVELSLSDKESDIVVCSNSPSITFKVSPADGTVEANPDVGNGVQIVNGKYEFFPSLVETNLHGTVINFTVNGQQTNCTATVMTQPDVTVTVDGVDYPSAGSHDTIVHFKVSSPSGQNFTNYEYICDFGNYGNQIQIYPNSSGNATYTLHNVDPKDIPVIKVKVSNKGCAEEVEIRGWYDAPSVMIKDIRFSTENCCQYSVPTITAKVTGPENVPLKNRSFKLNGEAQGASSPIYSWAQIAGPVATLSGANTSILTVEDLVDKDYEFQLTVVDEASGAFAKSGIWLVNVYKD